MSADERRGAERDWPSWLEALRPDDLTRHRIRRSVMARARPLLAERRPAGTWEVAAGWADVLVPLAAVASVLFALLATRAGEPAVGSAMADAGQQGVRIEELLADPARSEPPALLTRGARPDLDGILEAALTYDRER